MAIDHLEALDDGKTNIDWYIATYLTDRPSRYLDRKGSFSPIFKKNRNFFLGTKIFKTLSHARLKVETHSVDKNLTP